MSQGKEFPLNEVYFGPPIPPQQLHSSRCLWCLLSTFFKLIIVIIVVVGIIIFFFGPILHPNKLKFYVVTANLNQFDLTNDNTLNYNLSLNMIVRNPNKKIGMIYDKLDARASYKGVRFGWTTLPLFRQGYKSTADLQANFSGQSVIILGGFVMINTFNQAKNAGVFDIFVEINAWIRFEIGTVKTKGFKSNAKCKLRIPLVSNGTLAMKFEVTKCDFDF